MCDGRLPLDYLLTLRTALHGRSGVLRRFVRVGQRTVEERTPYTVQCLDGLSEDECKALERRFSIRFPADLRSLLKFMLPVGGHFPDWRSASEAELATSLARPLIGTGYL